MRLFEFNNTISFSKGFLHPVTTEFTQEMLDNELYVDDDSRAFKKWWTNPAQYFENGGLFSLAYDGDELVGIGVMLIPKTLTTYNVPKHNDTYVMFGKVGFFVKKQYRQSGVSNQLAVLLERAFIAQFPEYSTDKQAPVVFCSRMACDIAEKQFKLIITDKELSRRLDKTK